MESKPIQLPAYFDGVSTKKDGSIGIRISTQELSAEQKVQAMEYVGSFGYMMFAPQMFKESDVPKEDLDIDPKKTPSKRIRAVLYRIWEKLGSKDDFEIYYRQQTEKIIDFLKTKLD